MPKRVLIALDYNPTAQKVAETGHELANAMNADIALVHVVADSAYYASTQYSPIMGFDSFQPATFPVDAVEDIRIAAGDFLRRSKEHLGDGHITIFVKEGETAQAILEVATEWGADIIVMGTHSRRGLDKILMGSVAEQVLHHADRPIYIIPTREDSNS